MAVEPELPIKTMRNDFARPLSAHCGRGFCLKAYEGGCDEK